MSDAASSSLNLQSLEQDLQTLLHAEPLQSKPLQVRCVFKEGILIVLVQHGMPAMPYPRRAFRTIRSFLHDKDILKQYQVLMYLRMEGANQPYAFHTLTEQSKSTLDEIEAVEIKPLVAPEPITESAVSGAFISPELTEDDELDEFENQLEAQENATDNQQFKETLGLDGEPEEEEENLGFEGFTTANGEFEDYSEPVDEVGDRRLSKATLIFAASLAIVFSASAFYVLTRPCVIDRCETMSRASKLSDQSIQSFQNNPSGQEILAAKGQLDEAIKKLKSIPFWSPHYTEAQSKLKEYNNLSASLTRVINSLYKASDAAQMSQKPPFTVDQWTKIAGKWQEAIAGLSAIQPQDFYYAFAKSKLDGYQSNLQTINQRLTQEKEAIATLNQAKEEAKIAQVQQGVAQSLDSWEQAYISWANAIQQLESIPAGTTAFNEAQDLIKTYSPQMTSSQENQNKENLAQNIYNQGLRIADLAQAAQIKSDWEQAAFHWKTAAKYMDQVPKDSYQATLAQPAIARFNEAAEAAQVQLQLNNRLKKAELDLQKTCAGEPNICTFTLDENKISVNLTAAYVSEVQKKAVQASATNNSDAKIRLLDHIATLEQALEVISRNANVPVQVYDVNGVLLVDYKP